MHHGEVTSISPLVTFPKVLNEFQLHVVLGSTIKATGQV